MTGVNSNYPYITSEVPFIKINYSYSKYIGVPFLSAWRETRKTVPSDEDGTDLSKIILNENTLQWNEDYINTEDLILYWLTKYKKNCSDVSSSVLLFIKRFEVTKKIYFEYGKDMRPLNRKNFDDLKLYSLFGILLGVLYQNTSRLPFLNTLIKVNDILLGFSQKTNTDSKYLKLSINLEQKAVESLLKKKNVFYETR